ncbi:cysteine-rich receptor-like protein kinase 25 [Quercus suber]|uniref:Cysteine-rich receptor-like protein kinase 25 n=1 Tax=Quercus suber TaxID=58331 RepID=A0AAW0KV62_QUESU
MVHSHVDCFRFTRILLLYSLFVLAFADPPYNFCSNTTIGSPVQYNLNNLFLSLHSNASVSKFYYTSIGNGPDRLFGLYMCLIYITNGSCQDCITMASTDLTKLCPEAREAVIWEELCEVRYSYKDFYDQYMSNVTGHLFTQINMMNISEPEQYRSIVNDTLGDLTKQAAFGSLANMYATGEVPFIDRTIYALVQCSGNLSAENCNSCLHIAITEILTCCYSAIGARVMSTSCYLRYEVYPFYGDAPAPPKNLIAGSGERKKWMIIILTIVSVCLAIALFGYCVYCHVKNKGTQKTLIYELACADPLNDPPDELCSSTSNYTAGSPFENNLEDLFLSLSSNSSFTKFYKTSSGNDPDRVYGLYMCFNYVNGNDCHSCVSLATTDIVKLCPNSKEAFVGEELCQFRYSNQNFFGQLDVTGNIPKQNEENISEPQLFKGVVNNVLSNLAKKAAFDPNMYATQEEPFKDDTIYALVQCGTDLSANQCNSCLQKAISDIQTCCFFSVGARLFSRSCYLRYELYNFYQVLPSSTNNMNGERKNEIATQGPIFPTVHDQHNADFQHQNFLGRNDQQDQELPYFDFASVSAATDNFSDSNKLGEGGFGTVYKAWKLWNEGKGLELMDPLLTNSCSSDEFLRYVHIGLLCVQEDAYYRPKMFSVVQMLKGQTMTLCRPERPAFSVGRFTDHYETNPSSCSVNGLISSGVLPR